MYSEGPWEVFENSVRTVAPGRCVARMDWNIRDSVDDANARLIASAPDLLEALERALEFAVMTLAFHGRDRGTDRQEGMLDDLEKLARDLDGTARAVIIRATQG